MRELKQGRVRNTDIIIAVRTLLEEAYLPLSIENFYEVYLEYKGDHYQYIADFYVSGIVEMQIAAVSTEMVDQFIREMKLNRVLGDDK